MQFSIKFSFKDGTYIVIDRSSTQLKRFSEQLSLLGLLDQVNVPDPSIEDEQEVYDGLASYLLNILDVPDIVESETFRDFVTCDDEGGSSSHSGECT
eukprot:CAMPEP_0194728616 /NCGR_PEP_ID=MMETSP0296-20130528/41536_1 /TAXON_ID=39354 /ORGANISM="Heterosigma akashiwo, Strain CCMP2393" /LENGTH=96 /DNA_ID=CAMNT_0039634625 /DNA_START=33 /DNA_END=319 /DNA_ORIENTATION=+